MTTSARPAALFPRSPHTSPSGKTADRRWSGNASPSCSPERGEWRRRTSVALQAAVYIALAEITEEQDDIRRVALTRQLNIGGKQRLDEPLSHLAVRQGHLPDVRAQFFRKFPLGNAAYRTEIIAHADILQIVQFAEDAHLAELADAGNEEERRIHQSRQRPEGPSVRKRGG